MCDKMTPSSFCDEDVYSGFCAQLELAFFASLIYHITSHIFLYLHVMRVVP